MAKLDDMVLTIKIKQERINELLDIAKPEGMPNSKRSMFGETIESRLNRARWEGREEIRTRIQEVLLRRELLETES